MLNKFSTNTRGWIVTLLAASFMTINFMDKAILGITAKSLMADLRIQPAEFGMIASSFFLFFSISAVLFGFIANRYSSHVVMIVLAAIWGVSQFPLAFTASVPLLYFSRIFLGFGERPAYPMALHAAYKWFSDDKRNLPSSIIFQGITVGLLISGPILTYIMLRWDYHAAFLTLAIASLVWMVLWFFLGHDGNVVDTPTVQTSNDEVQKVPYRTLLLDRSFLGNMILYWGTYWIFAMMFTWIPSYLSSVLNYTPTETGWMFMIFTATSIPLVLGGSILSQSLLKRGVSSLRARGWLSIGAVMGGGFLIWLATVAIHDPLTKVIVLAIGCNLPQLTFVLSSTIVAEIAPPSRRSSMMSINSALATTGGLVAPALTGRFIQDAQNLAGGYESGFLVSAGIAILVGVIALLTIDPEASKRRFRGISSDKGFSNAETTVSAI